MGQIEIFRVGRIPVFMDFFFVLLAVLWTRPYWAGGDVQSLSAAFVLMIGLLLSILLHELGHAWAGRLFGIDTRAIELNGLGGLCHFVRSLPASVMARTVVGLAGPFANLLLWIVFGWLAGMSSASGALLPAEILATLAWANKLLLIFNLLPAFPLDGGRVLEAWLAPVLGPAWSVRVVAVLGLVISIWIVTWAFPSGIFLILLALLLAMTNWQMLQSVGGFDRK
jgi:Zn-dependent protease